MRSSYFNALPRLGYRATDMAGGFPAWRARGLPIVPPTKAAEKVLRGRNQRSEATDRYTRRTAAPIRRRHSQMQTRCHGPLFVAWTKTGTSDT
jgi:hypothetical protein